jgi:hypothetical protein
MRLHPRRSTAVLGLSGLLAATGILLGQPASAAFPTVRLLPGSVNHVDASGQTWRPETTCLGGQVSTSPVAVLGAVDQLVYQRQRVGVTSCRIRVGTAGTYRVSLLLAETGGVAPHRRVFDVTSGGVTRVRGLDISGRVGLRRATKVTFDAPAQSGWLNLGFVPRVGQTKVSGITVTLPGSLGAATGSTPTPSPSASRAPQPSPSPAATPSPSFSPSLSPSLSPSPSASPSASPSFTSSAAPSPSSSASLDPSFDRPSKDNPTDYRMHVDFNVVCKIANVANDDPIVYPGWAGHAHTHVFAGNTSANAGSTQDSLDASASNCLLDRDTASYWMPQLHAQDGTALLPTHIRAYYRAGTLGKVAHIPHGLKMIAGDSQATAPQSKSVAGWQCRTVSPDNVAIGKQATIPDCDPRDLLEGSVVFPNCWDGVNLDSADHKSHLAYGNGDSCDAAHPVRLPQLTLAYRYAPGTTNSHAYLASGNSGLTLHADFWNAWHQATLDALVDRCINDGVHCGDVSPKHFPGPMPS